MPKGMGYKSKSMKKMKKKMNKSQGAFVMMGKKKKSNMGTILVTIK